MAWPRAIGLGAFVAASALTGHAVAGGHSGGIAATTVALVATIFAARLLMAVPASPVRTTVFLLAAQAVAHLMARPLGHGSVHAQVHVGPSIHDHGDGLRRSVSPMAPVLADWVSGAVTDMVAQPAMLAGHGLAAVAAAVWLARGERLAMMTVAMMWATIVRVEPPACPVMIGTASTASIVVPVLPTRLSRYLATVLARRGPPAMSGTVVAV